MRRLEVRGAWYGECRNDGQYGALMLDGEPGPEGVAFSHIQTGKGDLELPPGAGGTLYLRVTPSGPFKLSGQSHHGMGNFEHASAWARVGDSYGVNVAIYDEPGRLWQGAPQFGSQGLRFFDGLDLLTGDQTVNDQTPQAKARGVAHLWEWTQLGDVTIGQSDRGCVAIYKGVRYQIEPGGCFFIRMTRAGEALAISIVKFAENKIVFLWLDAAEIATFPLDDVPPVVPITPPTPHVPPSTPEAKPLTNQIETVKRVRAGYPTPLGASHPAFLIEVAKATKAKLLRKDGGTHVTLPNGINVSQDILMFGDQGVDILGDGEGAATPGWGEKGTIAGEYIDVTGISGPDPTPGPSLPPVPDTSSLQAKIALLEASAMVLHDSLAAEAAARAVLAATVEDLKGRLDQLEGTAVRLGHPITVSGRTDTNSWHSHGAKLTGVL